MKGSRAAAPACDKTVGTSRGLFGRNCLMAVHSRSVSSYLMIRGPGSGA